MAEWWEVLFLISLCAAYLCVHHLHYRSSTAYQCSYDLFFSDIVCMTLWLRCATIIRLLSTFICGPKQEVVSASG